MEEMSTEIFESYLKSGNAVAKGLDLAKKIIRPGSKFIDIATICENEIINNGCELSFPINMSLNEIAAHYSPIIDDTLVIPNHGLLKVDMGAHHNGYIADAAITINLGNDPGIYNSLINATNEALETAIEYFKPGMDVNTIGKLIEQRITSHGVKPISNLGGHKLDHYNLHSGVFVPNVGNSNSHYKIKIGDAFAIEPFATNGVGRVRNSPNITIYRVAGAKKKNLKLNLKMLAQEFSKKFKTLPFSPRAIDFEKKDKVQKLIEKFMKLRILEGYNVFVEVGKGLVSQTEHTIVIKKDGAHVTTVLDNGL